jgi:predicted nucleic acid-binding protein
MIVVADSSPLIVLVKIGHMDVLPKLFGRIIIPPAVAGELIHFRSPPAVRNYFSAVPNWLETRAASSIEPVAGLHMGEIEALSLAKELNADFLLIDERHAYKEAVARKINAIGTVRVLERAAEEQLVDLKEAFDRIRKTDFWVSPKLLEERLKIFLSRKKP